MHVHEIYSVSLISYRQFEGLICFAVLIINKFSQIGAFLVHGTHPLERKTRQRSVEPFVVHCVNNSDKYAGLI